MTPADFEEREYEGPLYHQLELGSRLLWSPGQVLEFHLGFDRAAFLAEAYLFKLHGYKGPLAGVTISRFPWPSLPHSSPLRQRLPPFRLNCFIQAKRPEIGKRLPSNLAALGTTRPFYRFHITPHQQRHLFAAADRLRDRALFVYAAPVFGTARELFLHMTQGSIADASTFPDVITMEGHSRWYYNSPGAAGIPNQGNDRVDLGSLEERITAMASDLLNEESFAEGNLAALVEGISGLFTDDLAVEPRVAYLAQQWREIGIFVEENELPTIVGDYLRVATFSRHFNVRWLTVP